MFFILGAVLREWQTDVLEKLENQDDRKILFVVDEVGGNGKSFLADYMIATKDAIAFDNGKSADLKYGYSGEEYIIFDLVRSSQEHINYEIIETLKNGRFFNTKYDSGMKMYGRGKKVVVFMNACPDGEKLSHDRYDVMIIGE